MPGQRKEGKKLWGGYLEAVEIQLLDDAAKARRFTTRTDFLSWIAKRAKKLPFPDPRSLSNEAEPPPEK